MTTPDAGPAIVAPGVSERRLAAIMFTDMVGFTALMQRDEARARAQVARHREVVEEAVVHHGGQLVQFYGDGTLSLFPSAVGAVDCAVRIQSRLATDDPIPLRIGLHTGDVIVDGGSVFGDGVNVAARIQSLGVPGAVLVSAKLRDEIKNHPRLATRRVGTFELRNVLEPMEVFALTGGGLEVPELDALPEHRDRDRSVAVLPFVNMSADPDNEFFADGVSEEVINVLTRIEGLKVTGRTSSFAFKGRQEDLREIGRQLGVATVLEGSVRKAGARVRVTAQLISARDGYHLFSRVFDHRVEDIFATQDEIAEAISAALQEHLGPHHAAGRRSGAETRDPGAHEAFLRGLHHYNKSTPQGARAALSHFRAAAEADPRWALPPTMEASALAFLSAIGYENPASGFPRAEEAARRAIALAPALGEGHMALALVQMFHRRDLSAAEESFQRALGLSPGSSRILEHFSQLRVAQSRFGDAVRMMERAVELDPLSLPMRLGLGRAYYFAGRLEDCIREAESILELEPGFRAARDGLAWALLDSGRTDRAIAEFERLPADAGNRYAAAGPRGVAYARAGREGDARAMLALLEERAEKEPEVMLQMDLGMVHLALGEVERSLDYLEDAAAKGLGAFVFVPIYPGWANLSDHPRYRALMRATGLAPD